MNTSKHSIALHEKKQLVVELAKARQTKYSTSLEEKRAWVTKQQTEPSKTCWMLIDYKYKAKDNGGEAEKVVTLIIKDKLYRHKVLDRIYPN